MQECVANIVCSLFIYQKLQNNIGLPFNIYIMRLHFFVIIISSILSSLMNTYSIILICARNVLPQP